MALQQYCLRWKYHHSNLQTMFSQLLDRGCFCDVTLACEGRTLKAHRVVLCACSTYFDSILTNGCSDKDPIVIMKDCKFDDIKCLIEFMYKGEINVEHVSAMQSGDRLSDAQHRFPLTFYRNSWLRCCVRQKIYASKVWPKCRGTTTTPTTNTNIRTNRITFAWAVAAEEAVPHSLPGIQRLFVCRRNEIPLVVIIVIKIT